MREMTGETMATYRWTSRDLELLPENGKLYEIVDGELSPQLPGFLCQVRQIFANIV